MPLLKDFSLLHLCTQSRVESVSESIELQSRVCVCVSCWRLTGSLGALTSLYYFFVEIWAHLWDCLPGSLHPSHTDAGTKRLHLLQWTHFSPKLSTFLSFLFFSTERAENMSGWASLFGRICVEAMRRGACQTTRSLRLPHNLVLYFRHVGRTLMKQQQRLRTLMRTLKKLRSGVSACNVTAFPGKNSPLSTGGVFHRSLPPFRCSGFHLLSCLWMINNHWRAWANTNWF